MKTDKPITISGEEADMGTCIQASELTVIQTSGQLLLRMSYVSQVHQPGRHIFKIRSRHHNQEWCVRASLIKKSRKVTNIHKLILMLPNTEPPNHYV
jgi:hypothetical protein